jgi:diaminopimelate epimerase
VSNFNSKMRLIKYEALGNDYLVADEPVRFEAVLRLAPSLCDRHRGIGSDGILLVDPGRRTVRVINPDGSEAEKSGNGLRIAAAHLVLVHRAPESFDIQTPAGESNVLVLGTDGGTVMTELNIGVARVGERERLDEVGVEGVPVNVGNPHFVVLEGAVTPARARDLGPRIERDPRFPQRTNVQLMETVPGGIRIEIWERGAGYTLASGTSAAASAAAAMALGLAGDQLTVEMPGGALGIRRGADGSLLQVGSARRVFVAKVDLGDFT